jgi:hypothetical protein
VETNDAECASLAEKLGRQFVRIMLDKQDSELALSIQHQCLQEDSLRLLEEIQGSIQTMGSGAHGKSDFALNRQVAELEDEVSRHIALEQEASLISVPILFARFTRFHGVSLLTVTDPSDQFKKLIDALERQLVNANETERRLHAQLQEMHFEDRFCCAASSILHHKSSEARFLPHPVLKGRCSGVYQILAFHQTVCRYGDLESQLKASQGEVEQMQALTDQLHASLEQVACVYLSLMPARAS